MTILGKNELDFLQHAIDSTDGEDEYSRGIRNGIRLARSCITLEEPEYEKSQESCEKSLGNTDVNEAKKNVSDLVVFGNGDMFKLVCKASSQKEGWMKSTKACNTGNGCLVQVTTQQRNPNGSYAVAEALTFVPRVCVRTHYDADGNVDYRTFEPIED